MRICTERKSTSGGFSNKPLEVLVAGGPEPNSPAPPETASPCQNTHSLSVSTGELSGSDIGDMTSETWLLVLLYLRRVGGGNYGPTTAAQLQISFKQAADELQSRTVTSCSKSRHSSRLPSQFESSTRRPAGWPGLTWRLGDTTFQSLKG